MRNQILSVLFLTTFLVLSVGMVSACTGSLCSQTVVGGTVYQNDITHGVSGATVTVTCNGNTLTATSLPNGEYSVLFPIEQCQYGNEVTVTAVKEDLVGTEDGEVNMTFNLGWNCRIDVGIVNVPLVPEFGIVVGAATLLSAVAIFFVVRRK